MMEQKTLPELRLSHPSEHIPTESERSASVLAQYVEIFEVFKDEAFVTTVQIHALFRGTLCLDKAAGQTALEKAGPELWIALAQRIGYPPKPLDDYGGQMCVDHIVDRDYFTNNEDRSAKTAGDMLLNYGMLLDAFNTEEKMKKNGIERRAWYTERFSDMASVMMGARIDFGEAHGRMPTMSEMVKSTHCEGAWQPCMTLLDHRHSVHRRKAGGVLA